MAAVEKEDPEQLRAAQILVNLRYRKLRMRPEWVPMQPSGDASSTALTVAAALPLRRRLPERVSMQSGEVSTSLAGTVVAGVPERWPKAKRSGSRGETSKTLPGHAAAAAKGSGVPCSSEQERCAQMPAASAQRRPVVAALCYAAVAGSGSGSGPSSTSVAPAKVPMKTPSPKSPLDYGAGGSGAPSSADDAAPAPARTQAKRKGTGTPGSVGGRDDEGCSSPAKRMPVTEEEKPMPISVEPSESQTRASSGKGAPHPFDLNLPWTLDEDDDGCPDTS